MAINAVKHVPWPAITSGLLVALALTACHQSPKDRVYDAYKCAKAATVLGRERDAAEAMNKVEADLAKIAEEVSMPAYAMSQSARFQEDLPLYKYSPADQIKALQEIYRSDTCQALYVPSQLAFANETNTEPLLSEPNAHAGPQAPESSGPETTAAAVLKVGRESVADAQVVFTPASVVSYCRVFARILLQPQDLQDCLRMVNLDPDLRRDMPHLQDQNSLFTAAANLPLMRRFALCTSDQALRLTQSFADYDRCMPAEYEKSLDDALGTAMNEAREREGVGAPAFPYNNPLRSALQLSPEERIAYCGIPDVASQLEGQDKANCLNGFDPDAIAKVDEAQVAVSDKDAAYGLMKQASKMRTQEERDNFCLQSNVRGQLSDQQLKDCLVGLSPNNPSDQPLTDKDSGYRDGD